jgi:hypothetical protein
VTLPLPQRTAWAYFVVFLTVVVVTHVPGLTDAQGRNLGLFKIDPVDDVIHALSGVMAAFAAWHGARVSVWYLRLFGLLYGWDGVVGLLIGLSTTPAIVNLAANLPHLAIAAAALSIGFLLPWRG